MNVWNWRFAHCQQQTRRTLSLTCFLYTDLVKSHRNNCRSAKEWLNGGCESLSNPLLCDPAVSRIGAHWTTRRDFDPKSTQEMSAGVIGLTGKVIFTNCGFSNYSKEFFGESVKGHMCRLMQELFFSSPESTDYVFLFLINSLSVLLQIDLAN